MISYIVFAFYLISFPAGIKNGVIYGNKDDSRQDFLNRRDFESVQNSHGIDRYKNFVENRAFVNYPRLFDDQDFTELVNMDRRDFESVQNSNEIDRYKNFVENRAFVNYPRLFDDQDFTELGNMDSRHFETIPIPRGIHRENNFVKRRESVAYPRHFDDQYITKLENLGGNAMEKRVTYFDRCQVQSKIECYQKCKVYSNAKTCLISCECNA